MHDSVLSSGVVRQDLKMGSWADQASTSLIDYIDFTTAPLVAELRAEQAAMIPQSRDCSECCDPIPEARLRARPFTKLCVDCKDAQEEAERLALIASKKR